MLTFTQQQKTAAVIVAGVVVSLMLFGAGVAAVMSKRHTTYKVGSYQECLKTPGSQELLSFPGVCVTKEGQRFTGPQNGTVDIDVIGKRLDSANIPGVYYKVNTNGTILLSTTKLDELSKIIKGCNSGLHGLTFDAKLKEVGTPEVMCIVNENETVRQIGQIQTDLRAAVKAATDIPNICEVNPSSNPDCAKLARS